MLEISGKQQQQQQQQRQGADKSVQTLIALFVRLIDGLGFICAQADLARMQTKAKQLRVPPREDRHQLLLVWNSDTEQLLVRRGRRLDQPTTKRLF